MKKCIIFLSIILLYSSVYAGKIHIWEDENGFTHITQQPPPENAKIKEVVPYKESTNTGPSSYQQHKQYRSKELNKEKLRNQGERYWADENGDRHIITDSVVEAEKKILRHKIETTKKKYNDARSAPSPPSGTSSGYSMRIDFYKRKLDKLESKLSLLHRSPEDYFYQSRRASQSRQADQSRSVRKKKREISGAINPKTGEYYPGAGGGNVINPKTGEIYHGMP